MMLVRKYILLFPYNYFLVNIHITSQWYSEGMHWDDAGRKIGFYFYQPKLRFRTENTIVAAQIQESLIGLSNLNSNKIKRNFVKIACGYVQPWLDMNMASLLKAVQAGAYHANKTDFRHNVTVKLYTALTICKSCFFFSTIKLQSFLHEYLCIQPTFQS